MPHEPNLRRHRRWYARLLRLYPKPYRERFAEGMEQTFHDLLRERAEEGGRLLGCALRMVLDTSAGILRENARSVVVQDLTRRLIVWAAVVALLLMVPLVAMRFTDDVVWTPFDFAFAGVLLFGAGLLYELVSRKGGTLAYRAAVGLAVAAGLLLVWVNGAVGIIGSEDNPANLLYLGVLVVGMIGAVLARLEPRGMGRASFAAALAQILVPPVALVIWKPGFADPPGMAGVFALNTAFAALFVGSALLFRRAAAPARSG